MSQREANRKYYLANRKEIIRRVSERSKKCKAQINNYWRKKHKELKEAVLQKLGAKCKRCGFSDQRALQVDHVNGKGAREIRSMNRYSFLKKVLKDRSGSYQILCANCNWIKRYEKSEVPLKKKLALSPSWTASRAQS